MTYTTNPDIFLILFGTLNHGLVTDVTTRHADYRIGLILCQEIVQIYKAIGQNWQVRYNQYVSGCSPHSK